MTLDFGEAKTTEPGTFFVDDLRPLSGSMIKPFDAVIGLPLLAVMGWEVDQDHHRIRFFRSGAQPISDGVEVRIGADHSRLVTTMKVNGKQIAPVMIDTGSDDAVFLTQVTADETGFRPVTDIKALGVGGAAFSRWDG